MKFTGDSTYHVVTISECVYTVLYDWYGGKGSSCPVTESQLIPIPKGASETQIEALKHILK